MNQLRPKEHQTWEASLICLIFMCLFQLTGCITDTAQSPPSIIELCPTPESGQKIISGQKCPTFERSIGRLDLYDEEDNASRCTAIIVSPSKILTAAHCFNEFVFRARLIAGSESREVIRVVYHPEARFFSDRFEHDIAIAELDSPLSFAIESVTLAPQPQVGEPIYIFGYGRTTVELDTNFRSEGLFAGTMIVSDISNLFFDALYDGRSANTCRGDSGGPAYSFDLESGKLLLSGLVSSGKIELCTPGDVSVFTSLANLSNISFIRAQAPQVNVLIE